MARETRVHQFYCDAAQLESPEPHRTGLRRRRDILFSELQPNYHFDRVHLRFLIYLFCARAAESRPQLRAGPSVGRSTDIRMQFYTLRHIFMARITSRDNKVSYRMDAAIAPDPASLRCIWRNA